MGLRDYLDVLRRRIILVVVIVAVVGSVTAVLALRQKPGYAASLRLLVGPPPLSPLASFTTGPTGPSQTDLATEAQLVTSTAVAQGVITKLGLTGVHPDDLLKQVSVGGAGAANVLIISAGAAIPQQAIDLANAFAQSYLTVRRQETSQDLDTALSDRVAQRSQLESKTDAALAQLASLPPTAPGYIAAKAQADAEENELGAVQQDITALANQAAIAYEFGSVIQPATQARSVRTRALDRTILFGVLVGFPLALAVVLLLESFKNAVQTKAEAETETQIDVLGLIPFDSAWSHPDQVRLASATEPFSPVAEAYRALANTLQNAARGSGARIILVTSPGAAEGKTATAANLGVALSDIGRDVVVVEANTRRPRAYEFLQADPTPGLAEVLTGQMEPSRAVQWLRASLGFLASGTATIRLDLALCRADLTIVLNELRQPGAEVPLTGRGRRPQARDGQEATLPVVLVDAAGLLAAGEVSALAAAADGVLLVLRAGVTTRKGAALAAEQVRRAGGRLLGVALVGVRNAEELGLPAAALEYQRAPLPVGQPAPGR